MWFNIFLSMKAISFPFDVLIKTHGGYKKYIVVDYLSFSSLLKLSDLKVISVSFANSQSWLNNNVFFKHERADFLKSLSCFSSIRYISFCFDAGSLNENPSKLVDFLLSFKKLREMKLLRRAKSAFDITTFLDNSLSKLTSLQKLYVNIEFSNIPQVLKILSIVSRSVLQEFKLVIKSKISADDCDIFPDFFIFKDNYALKTFALSGATLQKRRGSQCIFDFLQKCHGLQNISLTNIACFDEIHSSKLIKYIQQNSSIELLNLRNSGDSSFKSFKMNISEIALRTMDSLCLDFPEDYTDTTSKILTGDFIKIAQRLRLAELKISKKANLYPLLKSLTFKSFICSLKVFNSSHISMLNEDEFHEIGSPRDGIIKNIRLIDMSLTVIEQLGCRAVIDRNRSIFKRKLKMILDYEIGKMSLFDLQVMEAQMYLFLKDAPLRLAVKVEHKDLKVVSDMMGCFKSWSSIGVCKDIYANQNCAAWLPQELVSEILSYVKYRDIENILI